MGATHYQLTSSKTFVLTTVLCKWHHIVPTFIIFGVHLAFHSSFSVNGQVYHRIGPLNAAEGTTPQFAQLYMYDLADTPSGPAATELDHCINMPHTRLLNREVMQMLQTGMHCNNTLVQMFKTAGGADTAVVRLVIQNPSATVDQRTHNAPVPTAGEVAAIIPGDGTEDLGHRQIQLRPREGGLIIVNTCSEWFLPSHFVLFFCWGELGWHPYMALQGISEDQHARLLARRIGEEPAAARQSAIPRRAAHRATSGHPDVGGPPDPNLDDDVGGRGSRSNITFLQWTQHNIQVRMDVDGGITNLIIYGRNLWQEFLVTCQATREDMMLYWVRINQTTTRAGSYQGVSVRFFYTSLYNIHEKFPSKYHVSH